MAVYNHLLFSELFFRQIRRNTDDLDNLRATLGTIRDTWQYYLPPPENTAAYTWQPAAPIDKNDVHQLRSSFIEPVFGYLELVYAPCDADDRTFFLYGDWEQKNRTGLCLVLPYSAHIEGRDPATTRIPKGRNYAQQLQKLLHAHDLEWGVLTNGRFWRLYHRSELSPTDTYLQVDLGNVISTEDIHDYIVFHRFFSRPAFVQENGRQRLDIYKEQSDKATQQIEDHLSTHVEEIVRYLSQGLVESCQANQEDITSRDTRTAIYQNALFLVYRLLFALYAEARDLLPLDNPTYADVCLRSLLQQVNHNHSNGLSYEDDYAMWDHLQALFALIDQGDADAEVPAYNGGLFDPGRRPFLTKHRIRNTFLQAALLRLAYLPAKGKTYDQDRRPLLIDYRDLSVRHLGSLYEGLLEYNLFVVRDEPRVVRATKKTTRYVPYSKAGKVRSTEMVLQIGEVYFSETEGERKATGSYYTPEDVVAYIVRNTVGEVLQDRQQRFLEDQAIQQQLKDLADTPADIPAYAQIQRALDEQFLRFVNRQILDLKVLDPAMGSGHFLVNVTHNIANFIVEFLNETYWENPGIDTDVAYWKRLVAERCIFGVDLNELAVELAKLCLWMTTTAKGKPLTFVDHHLRQGNSLIGAWFNEVGIHPHVKKESKQAFTLPLERFELDVKEVLILYKELYAKNQDNVDEVREKARLFDEEILPRLKPYYDLLTLHTSIHFGYHLNEQTYAKLGTAIRDRERWTQVREEVSDILTLCSPKHWFHWELEFPEVYAKDNAGFDVVLGNPPYGRYGVLNSQERSFIRFRGHSFGSGDSSEAFSSHAINLIAKRGKIGFIIPKSFTYVGSWTGIRQELLEKIFLISLCDVSQAFEEVLLEQVIFCACNNVSPNDNRDPVYVDSIKWPNKQARVHVDRSLYSKSYFPTYVTPESLVVAQAMEEGSQSISNFCNIWYGKGGLVPQLTESETQTPVLRGKEVGRYFLHDKYKPVYLPKDPRSEEEQLKDKQRKIVAQDIVSHIQNPYPHIQLTATVDDGGHLCLNTLTCFVVKENTSYSLDTILAILNSKLLSWYVHRFIFNGAIRTMHFMPGYADKWPLKIVNFNDAPENRESLSKEISRCIRQQQLKKALTLIDSIENTNKQQVILHDVLAQSAKLMLQAPTERKQIDNAIDQLVFRFYGLDDAQIAVVERSNNQAGEPK